VYESLKILEEDNLNIVLVYRDPLKKEHVSKILSFTMLQATRSRKRRVALHVFTNKPNPLYLEDVRDIILNNIHLTLTTRYHELDPEELKKLVEELRSRGLEYYIFVQEDLKDIIQELQREKIELEKISG
jgi:hypothetical protein